VAAVNWKRDSIIVAFLMCALSGLAAPVRLAAQDPAPKDQAQGSNAAQEPASRSLWSCLKQGRISFNTRFRFEGFERDGAPFTGTAYAPTLRLALGYETHPVYGLSVFAQGEAVIVTGPADYNDPTLPSQFRPNLPAIFDPKSLELSQGYVKWVHGAEHKRVSLNVGRQELALNDGRFLSYSSWRQIHGSFDAAKVDLDLPRNFSFTYAFINRFYREVGYNATDGRPPMHTDLINLAWTKQDRVRASLYGLLLDYRSRAQFALSTQTYGLRLNGPYRLNSDWRVNYTAEFAKQKNYGTNPNHVNENYYLGELGPGWRGLNLKAGYAVLGGRSATDLLTTPLAPPFNGWTDLFFNDPNSPAGNGLQAAYINASGPIRYLDGAVATVIFYDYHSDYPAEHYGSEFDSSLSYKIKKFDNRWEIGWRFGRYWADHLFTNAVRTSVYTSFTL
jgi:hypothetical protein